MATGLTSLAFIIERRGKNKKRRRFLGVTSTLINLFTSFCPLLDGLFERSLVAGVDTMQILFSHALVQISVMTIQIALVLIFTFLVFDIPSRGPFILVILLLVFQGATGMAFGMLFSCFWYSSYLTNISCSQASSSLPSVNRRTPPSWWSSAPSIPTWFSVVSEGCLGSTWQFLSMMPFCRHNLATWGDAPLDSLLQLLPTADTAHGDAEAHSLAWLVHRGHWRLDRLRRHWILVLHLRRPGGGHL